MDDAVLYSARNAFLVLLLVLVGLSLYQFATLGRIRPGIAVVWVAGAGTFYLSKWHYGRDGAAADGTEN